MVLQLTIIALQMTYSTSFNLLATEIRRKMLNIRTIKHHRLFITRERRTTVLPNLTDKLLKSCQDFIINRQSPKPWTSIFIYKAGQSFILLDCARDRSSPR